MTTKIRLEHGGRKKEREVRDHIERATATVKSIAERRGEQVSVERVREELAKRAEQDRQKGKI